MDWGVFAGAATDSFREERKRQRDQEWEDYQRGQMKAEAERQDQARRAASATLGRAGTEIGDATQANMGAANPDEWGQAGSGMRTKTYSEDDALRDYGRRMAALGDANAYVNAKKTGLEMKGLERQERRGARQDDREAAVDEIFKRYRSISQDPEKLKDFLVDRYNKAPDFQNGEFVQLAGPGRNTMIISDAQGNPIKEMQLTPQQLMQYSLESMRNELAQVDPEWMKYRDEFIGKEFERRSGRMNAEANVQKVANDTAMVPFQQRSATALQGLYGAQTAATRLPVDRENNAQAHVGDVNSALQELDAALQSGDQSKIAAARTRYNAAQARYSTALGKPMQLAEGLGGKGKGSGGGMAYELKPNQNVDGMIAHAKDDGRVLGWVTPTGRRLPAGLSEEEYLRISAQAQAQFPGVQAKVGQAGSGEWTLVFVGADGVPYTTPQEAAQPRRAAPARGGLTPPLANAIPTGDLPSPPKR